MKISTALQAANAKAGVHKIAGAPGLYLKKASDRPNSGSYFRRFLVNGKLRSMGLGAVSEISLADAREAAREAVKVARKGVDPIEERKRLRAASLAAGEKRIITCSEAIRITYEAHAPQWRGRYYGAAWLSQLDLYAAPILGKLDVNDVTPRHVAAAMSAALQAGYPVVARMLQGKLKTIFDGAIARGDRDAMRGNPADRGLMKAIVPIKHETRHFRRVDLTVAPEVFQKIWGWAEMMDGVGVGSAPLDAWLIMVLTATRPVEAIKMVWSEVDIKKALATLPPTRTKTKTSHAVPLSTAALHVLERRARVGGGSDTVFTSVRGGAVSDTSLEAAVKRTGIDSATLHGWRSVFSDWCGEIGGVDRELREASLAHVLGKVEGAYRRETGIELRRAVMERYARWLTGADAANILVFPARAG